MAAHKHIKGADMITIGVLWREKETGAWLVVDSRRTHTKMSDVCTLTEDINLATNTNWPPREIRRQLEGFDRVEVTIERNVKIK